IVPQVTGPTWSGTVDVPSGNVARLFVQKPSWATHLLVSQEAHDPAQPLCGGFRVYDPAGVGLGHVDTTQGPPLRISRDSPFKATHEGIYELTIAGNLSHELCPRGQKQDLRLQWIQVAVTPIDFSVKPGDTDADVEATLSVSVSTLAPALEGALAFGH